MKKLQTLKQKAIKLRKLGKSYQYIGQHLNIPKSTLSFWLTNIKLTSKQKHRLNQNWINGLKKARKKASKVHQQNRLKRINKTKKEIQQFFTELNLDKKNLELFLAGLYLGDGFKSGGRLSLGSSNPKIALVFITLIRKIYKIKEKKLRIGIYARFDQNPKNLVNFWSKTLNVPKNQFHKTQIDQRTKNIKSYKNYKGVCAINYFDVNLQRRILEVSNKMIEYVNHSEP